MTHTVGLGEFSIGIGYDENFGAFVGEVVNAPYHVRLSADTEAELENKFSRLLTRYMGQKTS